MITKEEAWDNYTVARDMAIDTKEWKPGWRDDMYREMDARVRAYADACVKAVTENPYAKRRPDPNDLTDADIPEVTAIVNAVLASIDDTEEV